MQNSLTKLRKTILHAGFQKYFFNTSWMFAEKALRLIAGLFVGAYVARYLGPSQYGLLNYVLSVISLITAFSGLGFDQLMVRELIKHEKEQQVNQLLGTGFILKLIAVFLLSLALFITVNLANWQQSGYLFYILIGGYFFEAFGIIDYFFQSKVWSKYAVWSQVSSLLIISVIRIILVLTEAPLIWFAATYSLDLIITAIGLVYFYTKRKFSIFKWKFSSQTAKELLWNSWPVILASLSVGIYMKIDQIMIKWMLGDAANGNYGVAVRLSEMWYFIPMAIGASLFPAILNAKLKSQEVYLSRLQKLYDLMAGISVIIAIAMTFLATPVVTFLFGESYSAAGKILMLYIWSGVFVFLNVANGKWIISENLQVFQMFTLILSSVLNVALNFVFIPYIGVTGAAIATLISYAFAGYFSYALTRKTRIMFIYCSRSLNLIGLTKRVYYYLKSDGTGKF